MSEKISESNFVHCCDEALQELATQLEKKDKNSALDIDYADGILNVEIEKTAQIYVINRNSASQKIWYSSPISGANYFSYDAANKKWLDKSGQNLFDKIFAELTQLGIF